VGIYQVHLYAVNFHDSPQGVNLLNPSASYFSGLELETIMTDKTYRGTFAKAVESLGIKFEVPQRPENTKGFAVEAKRWVAERTFAWLNFFRRVVIDYEKPLKVLLHF